MSLKELSEIHKKLDLFIRKYYKNQILRGTLLFLLLFLFFYISLVFGEFLGHFSIQTRTILFFSVLLILLLSFSFWIIKPLLSYFKISSSIDNYKANAILQKHFPELKDQLRNVLELEEMQNNASSESLISKAIEQKSENISVIPFTQAVKLQANLKYVKLIGIPVLILLGVYLYSPIVLQEGTTRIVNYNHYYEKPSDFKFLIDNDTLAVRRGENLLLKIHTEGKYIPSPIYIEFGGVEYLLQKKEENLFTYEFKNVNQAFIFNLKAEDYKSKDYNITVLPSPQIVSFSAEISAPSYTQIPNKKVNNNGDLIIAEGSKVEWIFKTKISINFGLNLTTA